MIGSAARPSWRLTETGLIVGAGIVLLWGMIELSVATFGHVADSSVALMGAALAMMLLVNRILAWRLPRADQVLFPIACILTGLGLIMIRRLVPGDSQRQLAGIGVGLLLLLIAALALRDYRLDRKSVV